MELCSGEPCPEGTVLHCGESLGVGGGITKVFCQGTASAVPLRAEKEGGFSR